MGESGVFSLNCRLELINGEIIEKAPIGSHYASHLKRFIKLFSSLIQETTLISVQDPLQLGDLSEPEPDFMLLRPSTDFYYKTILLQVMFCY